MTSHIVVVEDEAPLLEMLQAALEENGYEVTTVARPRLLPSTWEHQPDVFLIDIMLPDMDGIALASRLQSDDPEPTPMIATSASSSELRMASNAQLFEHILSKPFDLDELIGSIEQCLEHDSASDSRGPNMR